MSESIDCTMHLDVANKKYQYFSLQEAEKKGVANISQLPYSLKILLENLLRHQNKSSGLKEIHAFSQWVIDKQSSVEIAFHPSRVLMQDFTGVPAVADLAALRDAYVNLGGQAQDLNPNCAVDLVIDHSVQVDHFGQANAFEKNVAIEMQRNHERYQFLRWGQESFQQFRVVPPGTGICHQVNLEYLASVIWSDTLQGELTAFPDTLVGTDSHTTMINGLGVLGWGVGGIEAEAAMLGQAISMQIPDVIGVELKGTLSPGVTATDLVLFITQKLRAYGVVGKFVEYFGPGLAQLPLADRATIANMAPEYGATCGIFPIDQATIDYLKLSGRDSDQIDLVEKYAKAQGMFYNHQDAPCVYTDTITIDLNEVCTSLAGPKRPQDRVELKDLKKATQNAILLLNDEEVVDTPRQNGQVKQGDVVMAAITSCTNTSNPSVMIAAGLVAKKASDKGLKVQPWVKTSLAPGSKVVTEYLEKTALLSHLESLGFYLVGYGCTTCIGNSGPLAPEISQQIHEKDLVVCSVLSGNRNFEGRISPDIKANWLASPPLVVAFALAGTTAIDLSTDPLGHDSAGNSVYLKDIWPSNEEIATQVAKVNQDMFNKEYENVFLGDDHWQGLSVPDGDQYQWQQDSTYVRQPPFFQGIGGAISKKTNIKDARILALLGDSVTTDHISPAGAIQAQSPAGQYLLGNGIDPKDFNSYGSRRGNHEVMMRGTFANIRIRNEMVPGTEGGFSRAHPNGDIEPIYDVAMQYQSQSTPLLVIAGKEYGTGSSRDWAAKGTKLLGVEAVIAESFERIHRSNLIGMGVLPLTFPKGVTRQSLKLVGDELISIMGLDNDVEPGMTLEMHIERSDGTKVQTPLHCQINTQEEANYYLNDGILSYVLRQRAERIA